MSDTNETTIRLLTEICPSEAPYFADGRTITLEPDELNSIVKAASEEYLALIREMRETLSSIAHWNDNGHIDKSWFDAVKGEIAKADALLNGGPVKYGCHFEMREGPYPDCIYETREGCAHALNVKLRDEADCEYWKPIQERGNG